LFARDRPEEFEKTLHANAREGIYQISIATKELSANVESNVAHISWEESKQDYHSLD
jgi:hypothetical protein